MLLLRESAFICSLPIGFYLFGLLVVLLFMKVVRLSGERMAPGRTRLMLFPSWVDELAKDFTLLLLVLECLIELVPDVLCLP